jgi:hypothetical protein
MHLATELLLTKFLLYLSIAKPALQKRYGMLWFEMLDPFNGQPQWSATIEFGLEGDSIVDRTAETIDIALS